MPGRCVGVGCVSRQDWNDANLRPCATSEKLGLNTTLSFTERVFSIRWRGCGAPNGEDCVFGDWFGLGLAIGRFGS